MTQAEQTLEAPIAQLGGPREVGPVLIVALECDRPLALSSRHRLHGVDEVLLGRGKERMATRGSRLEVRVPDKWMSSTHATLTHTSAGFVLEDRGSRNGTRVGGVTTEKHLVSDGDLIELGHTLFLFREEQPIDGPEDLDVASARPEVPGILTLVPSFAAELAKIPKLAPSNVAMLLLGESGTGKEVLARAASQLSGRREFVAVNCGGLPATLIESELFGYKKGAFSGADEDRRGLVRAADGGTLFLDEIADLPAASQATLLRVLQEREVRPVGSTQAVSVDIRLISATHQDLEDKVEADAFRRDLYARISAHQITLPPVRERMEDLGILVGTLLARLVPSVDVTFDLGAARTLFRHPWPLNVRELENCLATAVALADGKPIAREHLPETIRAPRTKSAPATDDTPSDVPALSGEQREHREELVALFRKHRGNVSAVARATGKARTQIQRWLKRYALDPESYRR